MLKSSSPSQAAINIRKALEDATDLHEAAKTIGSITIELVRSVGFDVMPNPSKRIPNHHRIVHPDGIAGFSEENLARLSDVFTNTTGN